MLCALHALSASQSLLADKLRLETQRHEVVKKQTAAEQRLTDKRKEIKERLQGNKKIKQQTGQMQKKTASVADCCRSELRILFLFSDV
jgi:hypothetical protein